MYVYIHIYQKNAIVRQPHPLSRGSLGQEMFSVAYSDKQTHNYGTECPNHHPSQLP